MFCEPSVRGDLNLIIFISRNWQFCQILFLFDLMKFAKIKTPSAPNAWIELFIVCDDLWHAISRTTGFHEIVIKIMLQYYSAYPGWNPALSTVQLLPWPRPVSYQHTPQLPGEHNNICKWYVWSEGTHRDLDKHLDIPWSPALCVSSTS